MKEPVSPRIRVVIADDSRAARESLEVFLQTYPALEVVGTAENGREAIRRVEALRPDLVLLDLEMPELGGIGAARALRDAYPTTRILIVSVHDGPTRDATSREAGADEFLPKPLLPIKFGPAMERLFGDHWSGLNERSPESWIEMAVPLRVLIVEGSDEKAELILRELRAAGYDPRFERVETPDAMKQALERKEWDLVVSDYSMPRFDAPRALDLLKESGRDIPFILVADAIGEDVAVAMMRAGARDFVLQQNLSRFVPAVQRELREAGHRLQKRMGEQAKERLRIERDELLERLAQQNEDLVALTQVTANAIGTLDLDEVLRGLLARVTEVMKADAATILLAEGGLLRVAARAGVVDMNDAPTVRAIGEGFAGSIASCMEPAYVENTAVDPLSAPLIRERGIRSRLGVPLKHHGVLIGVIHVGWLTARARRDREVYLLETTAERCAAAVQNARLYREAVRMTAALTESEARFRRVVESNMVGMLFWDRSGAITEANDVFLEIVGFTRDDVRAGQVDWRGMTPPEYWALDERALREIEETEDCTPYEKEYVRKDGSRVPILIGGASFLHQPGQGMAFVLDISKRRQTEEQLRKLSRVVEQAPMSIVITDRAGAIEYVNPAFCELTGYAKEEVQGRNTRILKSGATPIEVYQDLWATLTAGEVWRGELNNRKKSGEAFVELAVVAPVIDADGRTTHYVALKEDITKEKAVEEEARESGERFEQLVQHIDEVFWMTDVPKAQMLYVSPAYEAIWGRTCASLMASPGAWLDAVHPEDRERSLQASLTDQASGAYDIEYRIVRPDGEIRWIHDRAFPVENQAGEVYRIVGVANDVTVRKQAHDALQASLREKEALLKEVHHRVKNNLQVITSLLRLETGRSADASTIAVLRDMKGRIQSMALLHETLYRSGNFAAVDLGLYLRQLATQSFRTLNERPGSIHLELDVASVRVEMDQAIPCGLLVNELISNCLKHGFPGERTGSIRVALQAAHGSTLRMSVADTGIGLPADFESKQARSLGLQLASDLAKQLGGKLEIESGPGSGASFAVVWSGGVRAERLSDPANRPAGSDDRVSGVQAQP